MFGSILILMLGNILTKIYSSILSRMQGSILMLMLGNILTKMLSSTVTMLLGNNRQF